MSGDRGRAAKKRDRHRIPHRGMAVDWGGEAAEFESVPIFRSLRHIDGFGVPDVFGVLANGSI